MKKIFDTEIQVVELTEYVSFKNIFPVLATIYRPLLLIVISKTNISSMMRISKTLYMEYKYSPTPHFQRWFN